MDRGGWPGRETARTDCDEAVRQLYNFLDGELTEERRRTIALHLDDCRPCADAAGFEAELRMVISARCKERVPDSLIAKVASALAAEEVWQRPDAPGPATSGITGAQGPTRSIGATGGPDVVGS